MRVSGVPPRVTTPEEGSTSRETSPDQHYFSTGGHYLLSEDFELGTRVGWGLNDASVRFFANVGIGLRY